MRPADTWKDYELLDATDGNRLERWGETLLIRPDPQVVWKTPKQSPLWAKADAIYHRSNQGGGEWEYRRRLPEKWKISCGEGEDKLTLIVSPTGFKHTGVFPEQAVNWAWYQQKIRAAVPGTPRVQIVVGDGLSSAAITANAMDCLAAIRDGLKLRGIDPGTPIFVRYCRVGAGDAIGDVTGCELVCMLVGERPGLVTDKSMSAYITYRPRTGVSESARTVVSNIHAQGTPAVEAGAHIAGLIETILKKKVSGVGLHLEAGA